MTTLINQAETHLESYFKQLEETSYANTEKVLTAFANQGLSDEHFFSVTGYGHNDMGREVTDNIYAQVFGAEAALVRLQFVSGTHAIACALRGCLQPGDMLLSVAGRPYDTLEEVIGTREEVSPASLVGQGIQYQEVNLLDEVGIKPEWSDAEQNAVKAAHVIFIQRSRGYSLRPSLMLSDIETLIQRLRVISPGVKIVVDNCYGEFIETREPTQVGADLIAGSLIKNPGGGIVPTGGYIAGKSELVERAAEFLTAPGIGADGGYTFNATRTILQGLYFAPTVVKDALKSMRLFATVFTSLGYAVRPTIEQPQADIIQVLELGSEEKVLAFCKTLQSFSPVGARLTPIPAVTPGYADPVVMAGGTFIFGSTIELSADAPMRAPYAVYLQGGLTYAHSRVVLKKMLETGLS